MTALISCFHICSPVLWIRLQIGSIFSNLVDPDPYSEHGSRSGYTQTQTDINLPPQSKLSSCAFNFVLYSLKKVFWKYKLYKKIDYELCEKVRFRIQIAANFRIWIQIKVYLDSQHWCSLQYCKNTIQCTYTYMCIVRYRILSSKTKHSSDELFHQTCFLWRYCTVYTLLLI